jgi:D-alanyl-D-alanine carboxypeptidase
VGKPPIRYNNTDHAASRGNIQVLAGKTGYNDVARYCLVVATRIDGHLYFMSFLSNEGKLTRFGDVARVADWILSHRPKVAPAAKAPLVAAAGGAKAPTPKEPTPKEPVPTETAPTPEPAPASVPESAVGPLPAPAVNPGSVVMPVGGSAPESPAMPSSPAAPSAPAAAP